MITIRRSYKIVKISEKTRIYVENASIMLAKNNKPINWEESKTNSELQCIRTREILIIAGRKILKKKVELSELKKLDKLTHRNDFKRRKAFHEALVEIKYFLV